MSKPKRSQDRKEALKEKIRDLWGKIYYKPMTTIDFFDELEEDYTNKYDTNYVYRLLSECQKNAEILWDKFEIIKGNKETIFKKWMDHCWLYKIPYILLVNGIAKTPKTYAEWERDLGNIGIKKLFGTLKSLLRITNKDMSLRGIDIKTFLIDYKDFLKEIPEKDKKDRKLLEDKEDDKKNETD